MARLIHFNSDADIGKIARQNFSMQKFKGKSLSENILSMLPEVENKMKALYKTTAGCYNEILEPFMNKFVSVSNTNEDTFYNLVFNYRQLMFPKTNNISFYIANYVLCSSEEEVSFLCDGLEHLNNYFKWRNQHNKTKITKSLTQEDIDFVKSSGSKLYNAFSTKCCVAKPQQYLMDNGYDRVRNISKLENGEKAINSFKNHLKKLTEKSTECATMVDIKEAIDPYQKSLDSYF